jgi:hypothetical protein
VNDSEKFGERITEIRVCGCKYMVKRSYRDLFGIFGKWLGLYLEIFLKTRGLLGNLWTVG